MVRKTILIFILATSAYADDTYDPRIYEDILKLCLSNENIKSNKDCSTEILKNGKLDQKKMESDSAFYLLGDKTGFGPKCNLWHGVVYFGADIGVPKQRQCIEKYLRKKISEAKHESNNFSENKGGFQVPGATR